eukprot:CAMPEP_0172925888 /NCGR_PEP_ID=MMETSP1075-20121228/214574_1 /TAXON_ID=2916 /ORGANISM="Ceratium fusus, Strain PA161109" /LENGTH=248 /DNA_ID=CAMNT_0013786849 /DNA_START=204 /DNA_END=947 /DNA_ORIENTATION=-
MRSRTRRSRGVARTYSDERDLSLSSSRHVSTADGFGHMVGSAVPQGHDATVIWLHGLGDTGQGWADTAQALQPALPTTLFLYPTAPNQRVTCNGGKSMPSWFDIASLDHTLFKPEPPGFVESASYVQGLVRKQLDAGIAPERIVLVGFSQGGAVALHAALHCQLRLGGVLMLSSFLASSLKPRSKSGTIVECSPRVDFFHGEADSLVPISWAREGRKELEQAGVKTSFRSYPRLQHAACLEEMDDVMN